MKYCAAFDIWAMPTPFYKHIQRGQWVFAGQRENKGVFMGVKKSGTVVVAWYGNAKSSGNYKDYLKHLHSYALNKGDAHGQA